MIVFLTGHSQHRGAECLRVLGSGEFTIVYEHKLIQDKKRDAIQLRHENRMNVNGESILGPFAKWKRVGNFPRVQWCRVEYDFARVTNAGAVVEHQPEFPPSDAWAIF